MPKGRVPPRELTCHVCGAPFVGTHSQSKYCSPLCKREGERKSWREYNGRNRDYRRMKGRMRYDADPDATRTRVQAYRSTEKGAAVRKKPTLLDPAKVAARLAVRVAIKSGKMTRNPCEKCGKPKAQAHHEDYSKPLEVKWLCPRCHGLEHRKPRAIEPIGDVV